MIDLVPKIIQNQDRTIVAACDCLNISKNIFLYIVYSQKERGCATAEPGVKQAMRGIFYFVSSRGEKRLIYKVKNECGNEIMSKQLKD